MINKSQNKQIFGNFQNEIILIKGYQILDFIGHGK